jgi:protein ImuB
MDGRENGSWSSIMARIVSVLLHRWPIQRLLAAQARNPSALAIDPKRPFVLSLDISGTPRIAALNDAAERAGLVRGDALADARAKVDGLQVHAANPVCDDAALRKLALWATRYTPAVSCWGEENGADGFFLDTTGAAHLFGGEEKLLADLHARLMHFGLDARLAIADTPGTAWALSRYSRIGIIESGKEAEALAPLPVEGLRLSHDTYITLRRLGFKRIGALIGTPRAPFAARFEKELLRRLDQALGYASEPLDFIVAPPLYHSARYLLEPIFTADAVVRMTARLMQDIAHALVRDGVGARDLRLSLYRVDGEATTIDIGLTRPTRDPRHVARLLDLRLERTTSDVEAGFGFETLNLAVTKAEPMQVWQAELIPDPDGMAGSEQSAALIDRLRQRLGPRSVRRLEPAESHLPERAENPASVIGEAQVWPSPDKARPRPLVLLPKAELVEDVAALVPEGPPRRFRWRGALHHVAQAQGPERIAGEWWRDGKQPTRDYYLIEDETGHRFWIYRAGLYGRETDQAQWFMHGLYA